MGEKRGRGESRHAEYDFDTLWSCNFDLWSVCSQNTPPTSVAVVDLLLNYAVAATATSVRLMGIARQSHGSGAAVTSQSRRGCKLLEQATGAQMEPDDYRPTYMRREWWVYKSTFGRICGCSNWTLAVKKTDQWRTNYNGVIKATPIWTVTLFTALYSCTDKRKPPSVWRTVVNAIFVLHWKQGQLSARRSVYVMENFISVINRWRPSYKHIHCA